MLWQLLKISIDLSPACHPHISSYRVELYPDQPFRFRRQLILIFVHILFEEAANGLIFMLYYNWNGSLLRKFTCLLLKAVEKIKIRWYSITFESSKLWVVNPSHSFSNGWYVSFAIYGLDLLQPILEPLVWIPV